MIRDMKWWDLEQVVAIEREVFGPTAWSAESFWGELSRDDRYYVVAADDEVRGYAGLWIMAPQADVQTIAVAPTARGRGLGSLLLRHVLDRASEAGVRDVHLEVKADNQAAIALYVEFGFQVRRTRPRYYPDFSDALVMEVTL